MLGREEMQRDRVLRDRVRLMRFNPEVRRTLFMDKRSVID